MWATILQIDVFPVPGSPEKNCQKVLGNTNKDIQYLILGVVRPIPLN